MSERLFKTLLDGRVGQFSGVTWPEPGKWFEVEGAIIPCISGLHLCRAKDLLQWLAPVLVFWLVRGWTAFGGKRLFGIC